jgi:chemotaxis signal transduction protein
VTDGDRLLSFEVAGLLYAMPITGVLEVAEMGTLASIPSVPQSVACVINYRGDALPVVRRERLLDPGDAESCEPEHVLVISDRSTSAARLGLDVDRVLGFIDGPGATARGEDPVAERRPVGGRMAHILDPARLVERARSVIEASLSGE